MMLVPTLSNFSLTKAGRLGGALLLLTALPTYASAQQTDLTALRALVPPPRETLLHAMALTVGMSAQAPFSYGFSWEGRRFPAEIARLQQRLQHTDVAQQGELYRQLGELHRAQQEPQEAKQAFERAITIGAKEWEQQPTPTQRGRLQAEYALALQESGRPAQAATQIRQAVQRAPHAWQVWAAAGRIRTAQAREQYPNERGTPHVNPSEAQKAWEAARAAFDTAVRLAPKLPQPYEERGAFLTNLSFAAHPSMMSIVAGLADYERALKLRPQEPYALAWLAWMEYTDSGVHYFPNQSYDNFAVWKVLPPAKRRRLLGIRQQITRLTASRDPVVRAQAYTGLAWLEYEFHDVPPTQAQQHLRLALQAQPDFPEAEEYLMHTFVIEEEWDALAAFSEEQERRRPDARLALIAAYACYKANRIDAAEKQTRAAITVRPEDPAANLFLAFLLLRSSDQEGVREAERCLHTIEADPVPRNGSDQAARAECAILRGFAYALLGQSDAAQRQFTRILQADKNNTPAEQGLKLLSPP